MAYTTIDKPEDYFNTVLYTGDDTDNRAITGVGFQPDFVWNKSRSHGYNHYLFDSVRGAAKSVYSNLTNAEGNYPDEFVSFDSDGFTISDDVNLAINLGSRTFVNWCWKAGGTASSNTDGSITSSVSANTDAGFSIVSYTGTGANATVGHGLSSAPSMIIAKDRDGARNWTIYHKSLGATKWLQLDDTSASQTGSQMWQDTEPTSSLFSIGTYAQINTSSSKYIAYCFAEKKGYSKFGSYTGNGNADGTFVYTGFKPAWILLKQSSTSGAGWRMHDNKRGISGNPEDETLYASASNAESTGRDVDFLSNGFKLRTNAGDGNSSGSTYIYMAFAESPFVTGASAIPTTAR